MISLDELLERDPYCSFLGLRAHASEGGPLVVLPGGEQHLGDAARRTVHGGVIAAFLETAALVHLRACAEPGRRVATVQFASDFLRPAALVDTFARVVVVRRGRRFAHVGVEAWQHDERRLVATGHGSFVIE